MIDKQNAAFFYTKNLMKSRVRDVRNLSNEIGRNIAIENNFDFSTSESIISDTIEQAVLDGELWYIYSGHLLQTSI